MFPGVRKPRSDSELSAVRLAFKGYSKPPTNSECRRLQEECVSLKLRTIPQIKTRAWALIQRENKCSGWNNFLLIMPPLISELLRSIDPFPLTVPRSYNTRWLNSFFFFGVLELNTNLVLICCECLVGCFWLTAFLCIPESLGANLW